LHKTKQYEDFILATNKNQAKEMIAAKNFGLYDDEFDLKKQKDFKYAQDQKKKMKFGDFHKSFYNDNGAYVDEFGTQIKLLKTGKPRKNVSVTVGNNSTINDSASTKSQANPKSS